MDSATGSIERARGTPAWRMEARLRSRLLVLLAATWVLASAFTLVSLWRQTGAVLDSALQETAERLLLELKGKLADAVPNAATPVQSDSRHDILNALLALGYNEREAQAAMKPLPADIGTADGIRQALKALSKA